MPISDIWRMMLVQLLTVREMGQPSPVRGLSTIAAVTINASPATLRLAATNCFSNPSNGSHSNLGGGERINTWVAGYLRLCSKLRNLDSFRSTAQVA